MKSIGFGLVFLLCGCSPIKYVSPEGKNTAKVTLINTIPSGSTTTLSAFKSAQCDQSNFIGTIAQVGHKIDIWKSEQTEKIEAEKKLYLSASHSISFVESSNTMARYECINFFSFSPIAGENYIVKSFSLGKGMCKVEVTNQKTSEAPSDLKIMPVGQSCVVNNYNF